MILPITDRDKISLELPSFTLDVNQIAVQSSSKWLRDLRGLANLEWNYFERSAVELCVTPEAEVEIRQGVPLESLGSAAYQRFQKTQLFKRRPAESRLPLSDPEANELWIDMRNVLWPTVADVQLTPNQVSDVSEIFLHAISSGARASNSAYVTRDGDFLCRTDQLLKRYGISVISLDDAWASYSARYGLETPSDSAVASLWSRQQQLFQQLRSESA